MSDEKGIVYILDMESSLADALERRVREMGQYLIFRPWDMEVNAKQELDVYGDRIKGIIISGSRKNINGTGKIPEVPHEMLASGIPILAVCYGMQYVAHVMGIPIVRCWHEQNPVKQTKKNAKKDPGEQGPTMFYRSEESKDCPLFEGLGYEFPIWMKHNWMVESVPEGWTPLGSTLRCPVAGFSSGNLYALQFHPEPYTSLYGKIIINNFLTRVCDLRTPYF